MKSLIKRILISKSVLFIALFADNQIAVGQEGSVFDANYFTSAGQAPPITPGRGFDVRDVYKPTLTCFTDAFTPANLKPTEQGQKSSITLHYTQNETEYSELKQTGNSGKISYLNLFSVSANKLKMYAQTTLQNQERIVFVAKVDFGLYGFDKTPELLPEATALLNAKDYDGFMNKYGTHYISAVRKGASIYVTLTKKSTNKSINSGQQSGGSLEGASIDGLGANFEVTDEQTVNEQLKSNDYTVSIEVNGPSLEEMHLDNSISKLLKDDSDDKLAGIKSLIGRAAASISDPSQGVITLYYYAPFSLLGGKDINWNSKKENTLELINSKVIETYATKSRVDKLVAPGNADYVTYEFDKLLKPYNFPEKEEYRDKIIAEFNKDLPSLYIDKENLETALSSLKKSYNDCMDAACSPTMPCSEFPDAQTYSTLNYKISKEIKQITDIQKRALAAALDAQLKEQQIPECEKRNIGQIQIINKSTNPYIIYDNQRYLFTIAGGGETTIDAEVGEHNISAEQKSGYLMYPTVNKRFVSISKACEGYMITIGYLD